MNTEHTPHQLSINIRGGMHHGARAEFHGNAIVVGSNEACDLMLLDEGVDARHCRLLQRDGDVFVTPEAGAQLTVNGTAPGDERRIEPGDILTIGACELQVSWRTQAQAAEPAPAEAAGTPAPPPAQRRPDRRISARLRSLDFAVVAVVLFGPVFVAASSVQAPGFGVLPHLHESRDLAGALQTLRLPELKISKRADGMLLLDGYVPDGGARQRLRELQSRYPDQRIESRFAIVSEVATRMRELLDEPGIQIEYGGAGKFFVSGEGQRPGFMQRIAQLNHDMGPMVSLERAGVIGGLQKKVDVYRLPIHVSAVRLGAAPYFEANEGGHYFVGAKLSDGAEVVEITSTRITFLRKGQHFYYQFSKGELNELEQG